MTWVIAIEDCDSEPEKTRFHAVDPVTKRVPHPLGRSHTIYEGQLWRSVSWARCQHCLEIVGRSRSVSSPSASE